MEATIDHTARVSEHAIIGQGTIVESNTFISKNAIIGEYCKIHKNIFIDENVRIGNCVKIQDNVMIPSGVVLEDGVFIGPSVAFTNDKNPRSITPDGKLKTSEDWIESKTIVKYGASIGANATVICGITLGRWCLIGAGAVITKDIPDYALAIGCPAKVVGWVSKSGYKMELISTNKEGSVFYCKKEDRKYFIENKK